jgi:chemotaxis protein methyltransferase CheR
MDGAERTELLRWAVPRLGLRWRGFRNVRGIVEKRLARRMRALGIADAAEYRALLERDPDEWRLLDGFCRIPISRFHRDRAVFERLADDVLPSLARARGSGPLTAWSLGCASGEEPYSLAIVWRAKVAARFPGVTLDILATDAAPEMIARAERGVYPPASLSELPPALRDAAFEPITDDDDDHDGGALRLRDAFRAGVRFSLEDARLRLPDGPFDLVLCRNLAFTYFDDARQRALLAEIAARLRPGGALVVGSHEALPPGAPGFEPWSPCIVRRLPPPHDQPPPSPSS